MQGTELMQEIMAQIREHLLPTKNIVSNDNIHHFNRVWEKIEEWHNAHVGQRTDSPGRKVKDDR